MPPPRTDLSDGATIEPTERPAGGASAPAIGIGIGIGTFVLAAAAVAALVIIPNLANSHTAPPPTPVPQAEETAAPRTEASLQLPPGPVLPTPVAPDPAPGAPDGTPPAAGGDPATPDASAPPAPSPSPIPALGPAQGSASGPGPVDRVAPPVFTADSSGGLVDPRLIGTGVPGASVIATSDDGNTWRTTADASGAWSVVANGLPVGATTLTAVQTDVAGITSKATAPVVVVLSAPTLDLRRSGPIVWHGTLSGAQRATVQVLVDGVPRLTPTLDRTGSGRFLGLGWIGSDSRVQARYAVDGRTGPLSSATIVGG